MQLSADLLNAIVDPSGGKITIVVGAGCSKELPTGLPLSRECAEEAYRRLIEDGVLDVSDCDDPSDLSALAEAVFSKTGSQEELVMRLPRTAFRNAKPNDGYLITAALLREQALMDLLNLNFDHGAMHALAEVNAGEHVNVVAGPEEHEHMGTSNVVYLHRHASAPANAWVLRKEQLEEAWRDAWEQHVAGRVLTVPVVVFAGLGSPAAVLVETCSRIRKAITSQKIFLVDPEPIEGSSFANALGVDASAHIPMGWCDFMRALADRVAREQIARINEAISILSTREGIEAEDCEQILSEIVQLGLVKLGEVRGAWLLAELGYNPARDSNPELFADLVLAVARIQRVAGAEVIVRENGNVELRRDGKPVGVLVPASGGGTRSIATLEASLHNRVEAQRSTESCVVIASALSGPSIQAAPPEHLLPGSDENDIVAPQRAPIFLTVHQLREDPSPILQVLE